MPKTGLVVSGGSAKGAFAVGVAQRLQENLDIKFDLVAGASTGAIIAPLVITDELSVLEELYSTFSTRAILMERNPLDIIRTGSVFETSALRNILEDIYTEERWEKIRTSDKQMFITTVNLQSGRVVHFYTGADARTDQDSDLIRITSRDMLLDSVFASAMQPVIMPTVLIGDDQYVDGGVKEAFPVKIVIDNGAEEIYGVALTAENEQADDDRFNDLVQVLKRTIDLFSQEVMLNDIRAAELYNKAVLYLEEVKRGLKGAFPGEAQKIDETLAQLQPQNPFADTRVVKLHVIRPIEKLIKDSLKFNQADMRCMLRLGGERVDELFPIT